MENGGIEGERLTCCGGAAMQARRGQRRAIRAQVGRREGDIREGDVARGDSFGGSHSVVSDGRSGHTRKISRGNENDTSATSACNGNGLVLSAWLCLARQCCALEMPYGYFVTLSTVLLLHGAFTRKRGVSFVAVVMPSDRNS